MQRTACAERLIEIPGYQILRRLNQSQFSATYLAKHSESSRKLVLKVFAAPAVRQGDFHSRFLQGCQALAQLRHPSIIQLYEGGVHRGACYLSLEYVSGATRIDELPLDTPRQGLQQIGDLARALHCAHSKGFVHGCIEAARVFVERERRVMLAGFEQQLLVSTPAPAISRYLSPERKHGLGPQVSGDIYGLGMLLYCLLARRPPREADLAAGAELRTVDAGVPALPGHLLPFQPLINRMLAPAPEQRFSSAASLADAIDAVSEEDMEAVHLATPHYLASIRATRPSIKVEVPTLHESVPMDVDSSMPEPAQAVAQPPSQGRAATYLKAFAVCALLVVAVMLFWERGPSASELRSWLEGRIQMAAEWWLERDSRAEPSQSYSGVEIDPVVEARIETSEPETMAEEQVAAPTENRDNSDAADDFVEARELSGETPLPEEEPAPAAEVEVSPYVDASQYVEEGDRLLAADALTVPEGANALEAYQLALALDPRNARAWEGLQRIVERYIQLSEARIADHDMKAAAEFVRRGLAVDPYSRDLLALQSLLKSQSGAVTNAEDLEKLSAMARIQMVRENYVTPVGESAYDHYSRWLLMEPDSQEARSALARIERELARDIELQVNRNRFDEAQALLAQARDAFPTSQRFHNLNLALDAALQSERERQASLRRP